MRKHLLLISFFIAAAPAAFSQPSVSIDNTNYYQFRRKGASINWLRVSDAVPIIIDELLKNGIAYHTIGVGQLVRVNDSTRFVVTVTFEKGNEYGFLYEATHGLPLDPKNRDFLRNPAATGYVQAETNLNNKVDFMRVEILPQNIFLLKQTVYWFQFDDEGSTFPVSKEVSQNILRQDIRQYLKNIRSR